MRRRTFLKLSVTMSAPLLFALGGGSIPGAAAPTLPALPALTGERLAPTPACFDDDDVTPRQTEGPFYTRNTPERTSLLEPDMTGTKLVLTGYVVDTACQPISGALLDFWQADDRGVYDNVGYRLRGHQFADDAGAYRLETIVPAVYTGRTRHIHVKVQAPNQPVLTTQLYFPNVAQNATDWGYRPELVVDLQESEGGQAATFNFVLSLS